MRSSPKAPPRQARASARKPEASSKAAPKLAPFLVKVRRAIRQIPRGQTMSYGGVALVCGVPQGARAVVRALHSLDDIPWWRVCRANGSFAPQCMPQQEQLLRQEGWLPRERKRKALAKAARRAKKPQRPGANR